MVLTHTELVEYQDYGYKFSSILIGLKQQNFKKVIITKI